MPEYLTRRLIAADSMRHDGRELKPGDEFEASEVDARYLVGQMRAREVSGKDARVLTAPQPRPVETKTEPAPATSDTTADTTAEAPEQPAEDGAMTTADAGKPATPRGRRASPSTNHANTGTRRRT